MADETTVTNNVANIALGEPKAGGAVFVAPIGTTIPTDASTPLPAAYKGVGYISTEGMKEQPNLTTVDIKVWDGVVVASPTDEYTEKFILEMMETNMLTMGLIHGEENVTGTADAIKVVGNAKYRKEHIWVVEELIGNGRIQRTVIPRGMITNIGEIVHKRIEAKKYATTIGALADDSGNCSYKYYARIVEA